jgi:NAD(P)-dependent dehydrogenase (short-subunit alcohol dehydrogenase family)
MKLKKLREQVVVITGASSGIGLATARRAARKGARLVLAARNDGELRSLCDDIRAAGGSAHAVPADVGREEDVRRIAGEAVGHFGGFDTWVNNAGVGMYGRIMEISTADARRLFETNFWGLVYGSRVAVDHLRHNGGALINVGSVVSDVAVPLQGFYSASKHAVKGFTDALRMELEEEGAPVSITLIKPAAIDTPYTRHAKNYLEDQPQHVPPVYDPELVADAILHAAEHPVRDQFVGGGSKFMSMMGRYTPRVADKYMEKVLIPGTHSGRPSDGEDTLHSHSFGGEEHGDYPGMSRRMSAYTSASLHPVIAGALGLGATLALSSLIRRQNRQR